MNKIVFDIKKATRLQVQQFMTMHIERTEMPDNCNPELTHLNRELVPHPEGVDRTQAIVDRIESTGVKVRKNSVIALQVLLTASHEGMKEVEKTGKLDEWIEDSMQFLRDVYGVENVVAATLHLDEKTPHIHATIVPIVTGKRRDRNHTKPSKKERQLEEKREQKALQKHLKNGGTHENFERGNTKKRRYTKKDEKSFRLCADDLFTSGKLFLARLKYYNDVGRKYGFDYGEDHMHAPEPFKNKKKHKMTRDYYKEIPKLEKQFKELQQRISEAKSERNVEELKTSFVKFGTDVFENLSSRVDSSGRKQRDEEIADLKNQLAEEKKSKHILQINHNNEIAELRDEQAKILKQHNDWRDNVINCIPLLWEQLRIAEICKKLFGYKNSGIRKILRSGLKFTGLVKNPNNHETYNVEELKVQVQRNAEDSEKLELRLDDVEHTQWLKQKADERKQKIVQKPIQQVKRTGIRM